MGNGNDLLDAFVAKVKATPCGERLKAPWTNLPLDDKSQAAAAALIHYGVIGMSAEGKLYLGRDNVGNPFFRMLNGWLIYPFVIGYIWLLREIARGHSVIYDWFGLVIAVAALVYCTPHFIASMRYSSLFVLGLTRSGEMARFGSLGIGMVTSIGAAIGLSLRIF